MKESDQTKDSPLNWDLDQSWSSFRKPAARLCINTLDFSDLWDEEDLEADSTEDEGTNSTTEISKSVQVPPAPPPLPPPPPPAPLFLASPNGTINKSRTLKLHWTELHSLDPLPRMTRFGTQTIWAKLEPVHLDTNRLEYLFKSKGNSTCFNVVCGQRKQTSVSVLGMKRSNIITITLSSLPPPRLLPRAIYSMDSSVLDREDVQRLQALTPTEEELCLIKEAKAKNPHSPLAPAELCLLTLGEITHLSIRLQLWAFALDYDSLEREIAEPLFHLKLAMEQLAASQTFKCILATVLAIGNFLNGCKYDYSLVQSNLTQLEAFCKASWEQLKILDKAEDKRKGGKGEKKKGGGGREEDKALVQDGSLRHRLPKILKECEEKLKVLKAVHRRVINRFHSFLLFLGYSRGMVRETKAEDFCKTISNFSMEYRATWQAILLQIERERQKSGTESPGLDTPAARRKHQQTPAQDNDENYRLEELLRTPEPTYRVDVTMPQSRRRMADIQGPLMRKLKW
ncbi:hypothetical protein PAMP_015882 [Pampus punctatissimus]